MTGLSATAVENAYCTVCKWGKTPPPTSVSWVLDKTTSDGDAPVLELWDCGVPLSLTFLPGSLWPGLIVPHWVPSMGQIEPFSHYYYLLFETVLVSRVFANGPGDLGSILGRVTPKTLKMVLDTSLLNTKVRIKVKVEQSRERSNALPYTSV